MRRERNFPKPGLFGQEIHERLFGRFERSSFFKIGERLIRHLFTNEHDVFHSLIILKISLRDAAADLGFLTDDSARSGSFKPCPVNTHTTVKSLPDDFHAALKNLALCSLRIPATLAALAGSTKIPSFLANKR